MKNMRRSVKHVFAALLFCLVLSTAMVCLADEKGTVSVESAKIREKADASSRQLGSVAKGGNVDIAGETTGADGKKWYQVYVDANTKGFIRADLIKRSGSGSLPTVDGSASTSNTGSETISADAGGTSANVTPIEAKAATVKSNSVNVRKSASTDSASIATVRNGVILTVTGETTGSDGKKWYQVSFKHNDKNIQGFIRADLVTFDNLPADAAISTEITGSENGEGQTEPQEAEPQEPEEPKQESNSGSDEYAGIIYMNVEEDPYIMPGFELVSLDWNNQKIKAYRNGTFFILYAQKQNGDEGWYLLDRENNVYQRYPYTAENVTVPSTGALSGSLVPIIAMGAVIVVLVLVILILFVKLRGNGDYYEEYESDDDYPDDDIEDIDDLEDEMDDMPAPRPARRPAPQNTGRQPSRRPMPQGQGGAPQGQNGQPPRRPAPQGGAPQGQNGQPPRRPAPQGQGGAPQGQNGQPPRRPAPQGQNGQPPRRPAPQGQGGSQGQRRPSAQNNRPSQNVPQQRGQKAKSMLSNDEDDMDFIDI